ncbi:MAG TPA: hypothetical protein EYN06_10890 [Myxococcales bacterium]|nr:hypothetical protein [Myxococcales bacterium]HIN86980.1 hypothetical protein [Myxococcales bacterium]
MSRLADKLARLVESARPTVVDAHFEPSLETVRPWITVQTQAGSCLVYRKEVPLDLSAECTDFDQWVGDSRLSGFCLDKALFLDIETTGLSSGAGTIAFLIGLAFVENGKLILEQLFLDDPVNEAPLLEHLLNRVNQAQYLVSFNGKSFDLSILQSRLVITRLLSQPESELKLRPHLDLLHVSRSAYRGVFANGRLQTLEREVLGHPEHLRADDIPGSLIPTVYFHFLQSSDTRQLGTVLRHNEIDVVSMVELTLHLATLFPNPPKETHPLVLLNLGKTALRLKQNERAACLLSRAADACGLTPDHRYQALELLVSAYRRAGNLEAALSAAQRSLQWLPQWAAMEDKKWRRRIQLYSGRIARRKRVAVKPPPLLT